MAGSLAPNCVPAKHQSKRLSFALSPLAPTFVPAHPSLAQHVPFYLSPALAVTSPSRLLVPPLIPMFHDLGVVLLAGVNAAGIRAPKQPACHPTKQTSTPAYSSEAPGTRDIALATPEHTLTAVVEDEPGPAPTQTRPVDDAPKARQPHSAWRVVGGGVMMTGSRSEYLIARCSGQLLMPSSSLLAKTRIRKDPIKRKLPCLPAAKQQSTSTGVDVLHTRPSIQSNYTASAYPTPASPPMHANRVSSDVPAHQQFDSLVQRLLVHSPQAFAMPADQNGGWTGWEGPTSDHGESQPPFIMVPTYDQANFFYTPLGYLAPPPQVQQSVAFEHQQHQAAPFLYGQTPTALTGSLPYDKLMVVVRAEDNIDVCRFNESTPTLSPLNSANKSVEDQHERNAIEDCDLQRDETATNSHSCDDHAEEEMEINVQIGDNDDDKSTRGSNTALLLGSSSLAPVQLEPVTPNLDTYNKPNVTNPQRPVSLTAKRSWADEVEEADPQWLKACKRMSA